MKYSNDVYGAMSQFFSPETVMGALDMPPWPPKPDLTFVSPEQHKRMYALIGLDDAIEAAVERTLEDVEQNIPANGEEVCVECGNLLRCKWVSNIVGNRYCARCEDIKHRRAFERECAEAVCETPPDPDKYVAPKPTLLERPGTQRHADATKIYAAIERERTRMPREQREEAIKALVAACPEDLDKRGWFAAVLLFAESDHLDVPLAEGCGVATDARDIDEMVRTGLRDYHGHDYRAAYHRALETPKPPEGPWLGRRSARR